jgi:hypothetical protein
MILMISSWISGEEYFSLLLVLHYSYMISKYWVTLCLWIQNCHKITWLQSIHCNILFSAKWAKNVCCDEQVKDYLRGIFAGGESRSHCRNMRVWRDESRRIMYSPEQYQGVKWSYIPIFSRFCFISYICQKILSYIPKSYIFQNYEKKVES